MAQIHEILHNFVSNSSNYIHAKEKMENFIEKTVYSIEKNPILKSQTNRAVVMTTLNASSDSEKRVRFSDDQHTLQLEKTREIRAKL